ncbi:FAD-dependent oxidoreductase, partial [Candidatus Parcubacteria bacterium]|nr:FAD-dependent oxidoreductase [Candidatus Parcubacteria bacterium]
WASEIENYPGFKKINSFELINKMQEQVKHLGVEMKTNQVKKITKQDDVFAIHTNRGKLEAQTVILALGLKPRRLAVPGEKELTGKGVSYCAICDSPFYKNKIVAVAGGGNSALDAAEVLSKIAKKVYLIHRREEFRGFEILIDEVKNKNNVEFILNSEVKEIIGTSIGSAQAKLEKIKVFNNKTKQESELAVDGLFIEIGRIAQTDLVADLVKRDERNQIIVDEKCQTNLAGMFAAGDVTPVEFKQITIACGQGTIAALAAYQYIQMKRK